VEKQEQNMEEIEQQKPNKEEKGKNRTQERRRKREENRRDQGINQNIDAKKKHEKNIGDMEKRQKIQERMKQYLLIMINKRNMQEISKKREHRGDGEE
jgi:hypothetical protein